MLSTEQKNEILCAINRDRKEKVYEPFSGEYLEVYAPHDTHAIKWKSIANELKKHIASI